jgi:hypothetical protein
MRHVAIPGMREEEQRKMMKVVNSSMIYSKTLSNCTPCTKILKN